MAQELGAYLEAAAAQGHAFGVNDCLMFPANWLQMVAGRDPAAQWRGAYNDQDGAARILAQAGGPVELMRQGCEAIGAAMVSPAHPGPGAVGIVRAPTQDGVQLMGAIRTPTGWAVLDDQGVSVGPFLALAAWAVI